MAEAAAHVLTTEGHKNKTYTLTNTESIGFKYIAENISAALCEKIVYKSLNVEEYRAILEKAGIPEMYIGMFTMWSTALKQQTMDKEDGTLSTFLNRKPTSVSQFIGNIYS